MNNQKKIAIITARGGSKRIKNKNLINFFGKPLISYSILAAKKTKIFDDIYVTTDSLRIKSVAEKYGASVPYLRNKKLSNDFAGTQEVVQDVIVKLNLISDMVCCIYPTAPLMRPIDIKIASKMIPVNNYIFSANKTRSKKERVFSIDKKNRIKAFIRSQNNNFFFTDSGQFYWAYGLTWIKKKKIVDIGSKIKKIPKKFAHDLNDQDDLLILKKKFKNLNNG